MTQLNPVLLQLASRKVWGQVSGDNDEKRAFQPPGGMAMAGGAPPADPSMGPGAPPGAGGGVPPMDPAMMGMDPSMMGGMPPGGAPPMPGGMPPGDPAAAMQMGMGPGGQKIKPEQWMQALDFRLYNLQQQITALLNNLGAQVPAGALITPPGMPAAPTPESAMPGGPQDPSQSAPEGGGDSAIGGIDPIQGASPEMVQGKVASAEFPSNVQEFQQEAEANCPAGYRVLVMKAAATGEGYRGSVDEDKPPTVSSPPKPLRGPHPGKTPSLTEPPTAGGSKDPKSRTEASDPMGPANVDGEKTSAQEFAERMAGDPQRADSYIGEPVAAPGRLADSVAATAAMYRSRSRQPETV